MSLLVAMAEWWADQSVADCRMLGWSIRSIGRTGKVMQFLSATVIALEIIGYDRLQKFGVAAKSELRKITTDDRNLIILCVFLAPIFLLVSLIAMEKFKEKEVSAVIISAISIPAAFLFVVTLTIAPIMAVIGSVQLFAAFVLTHPRLRTAAQILSVVLLMIGFLLDLLAS